MQTPGYTAVACEDAITVVHFEEDVIYLITYVEDGKGQVEELRSLLDREASWDEVKAFLESVPTLIDV